MAQMIPDRMPSGASRGEKRLFDVLSGLPDDCIVYYEPVIRRKYPDFVVIAPTLGLLVIEVKGWRLGEIESADSHAVVVKLRGQEQEHRHPVRQARDYMFALMDRCREHRAGRALLNAEGQWRGRFYFPFTHFAVLSNVTADQLMDAPEGLREIFPPEKCVTRDRLASWLEMEEESVLAQLEATFDVRWDFPRIPEAHVDVLRAMIHGEFLFVGPPLGNEEPPGDAEAPEAAPAPAERVSAKAAPAETASPEPQGSDTLGEGATPAAHPSVPATCEEINLSVLDLNQERHALSLGEGHRILYGVAGSGKTVLLLARVRWLAQEDPARRLLFVCFNVSLAAYLQSCLRDLRNVQVFHFDGWARDCGAARRMHEDDDAFGERFLAHLRAGHGHSRRYHTVLIDEAQDFAPTWFQCALEAMEDPDDGDLVIVGDANQGLYRKSRVSWRSLGIDASGRTYSKKFDLHRNYRNTREIVELASVLVRDADEAGEDSIGGLRIDPELCRRHGPRPLHLVGAGRREETHLAAALVRDLVTGRIDGLDEPLDPHQIGILYPRGGKALVPVLRGLLVELETFTGTPAVWLSDPAEKGNRRRVADPGVKVQTIHSAKGLQYRAVIVLWADQLPSGFEDADEAGERRLLYVALTRAEDLLALTSSGPSPLLEELSESRLLMDTPGRC